MTVVPIILGIGFFVGMFFFFKKKKSKPTTTSGSGGGGNGGSEDPDTEKPDKEIRDPNELERE